MHGSVESVTGLLATLLAAESEIPEATQVGVCPALLHVGLVRQQLAGSRILLGAQNAHAQDSGAYTGEVSVSMLAEYNVHFVIVGHSERRQLFAETDAVVAEKFAAVQKAGLIPILCLGETLDQREQGETEAVVLAQLDAIVQACGVNSLARAVVAYEPIWAIGTGRTASPEQAQAVHQVLRQHVAAQDEAIATGLQLLYGGSVKAANAAELFGQPDIDGGLVGGASLQADEFIAICKTAD